MHALVTRPLAEATELAEALAARGIATVIEPLLEVQFRDTPLDLAGIQAVLCTSANGVRALARVTAARDVKLFAVGDATAARARAVGFTDVASAGGTAADLARLAGDRLGPDRGALLHAAGAVVVGDLASDLRCRGFTVECAVLYEARAATALSAPTAAALATGRICYALFFSPRTAATFVRLADRATLGDAICRLTAVSISAAADAPLAALRFAARHVAAAPNQTALLAALDAAVAAQQHGPAA